MKKRLLAVTTAALLLSGLALSACDGSKGGSADDFEDAVAAIVLPLTKDSAQAINDAYGLYDSLGEEAQRGAAAAKDTLDGYAEACNAIYALIYRAGAIGGYDDYEAYGARVAAAESAYDALLGLGSYASDKDVAAAKALIDEAAARYDARTAQIAAYTDAVASVGAYDDASTLYSEWAAKIAAAETAYAALEAEDDGVLSLSAVSAARVTLREYREKKGSLEATLSDLTAKVDAAEAAYEAAFAGGTPTYNEQVNAAFDAAEEAYLSAAAVNLTNDAATASALGKWNALQGNYNGVRYSSEFEAALSGVEEMLRDPALAAELETALASALAAYEKIPEADRGGVAELKAIYDGALAALPSLKVQNEFILSVSAVDFTTATDLAALTDAVSAAKAHWKALTETHGYAGGVQQVDDAKALLDEKSRDLDAVGDYVTAVSALPPSDEIVNTKEVYDQLSLAAQIYGTLSSAQKEYPLVSNANMTYSLANSRFEAQKSDMFSTPAFDAAGTPVGQGFAMLGYDADTGLISGSGAAKNYLQAVYAVAAHDPEHKVGGVVVDEANAANVTAAAVQAYMKENFEYVFTVYDATDALVGEVRKDLVFEETAQVPTLLEVQQFFPLYHNESGKRVYSFGVRLAVKAGAADEDLHYSLRDGSEVKSAETSQIDGYQDPETMSMLSPAYLIYDENNTNLQFMRSGSNICAYGKALDYVYVGAYDLWFYLGKEVREDALIDWIRVVPEEKKVGDYPHTAGAYVRTFLGSSLAEKGLAEVIQTDQEYIAAGVTDITATVMPTAGIAPHKNHGWLLSNKKGYGNAWAKIADVANLFRTLGFDIPSGADVTVVARLKVNAAGAEAGIKDSPFSEPVHINF